MLQRYSWDWYVYLRQPRWLVQELTEVMSAEGEALQAIREQTEGHRIPDPGDRDDRQFAAEVKGAGLPMPARE